MRPFFGGCQLWRGSGCGRSCGGCRPAGISGPGVSHGGGVSQVVGGFPDGGQGSRFLGVVSVVWAAAVVFIRIFPLCLAGWGWGGAGVGELLFAASSTSARSPLAGRAPGGRPDRRTGGRTGLGCAGNGELLFTAGSASPRLTPTAERRPDRGRTAAGQSARTAEQVGLAPGIVSRCSRQAAPPQDRHWQAERRPIGRPGGQQGQPGRNQTSRAGRDWRPEQRGFRQFHRIRAGTPGSTTPTAPAGCPFTDLDNPGRAAHTNSPNPPAGRTTMNNCRAQRTGPHQHRRPGKASMCAPG